MATNKAGILNVIIGAKISDFLTKMQIVERQTKRTSKNTSASFMSMKTVVVGALTGIGVAAYNMARDFDKALTKMQTLASATKDQIKGFKKEIFDLSAKTGRGPVELAESLYFVTSSGFEGAEALDVLAQSAKAAAIGMGDSQTMADALTSVMNAYGHETYTAAQATEIFHKTVSFGKAEADQLAGSIAGVTPIAAQLGVKFEDLSAGISTLTLQGNNASEAVTMLASLLNSLIKESSEGEKALGSVGLTYADLRKELQTGGLPGLIDILARNFRNNDSAIADIIGRKEGMNAFFTLAGNGAENFAAAIKDAYTSTDSFNKAVKIWESSDSAKIEKNLAAIDVNLTKLGNITLPIVNIVLTAFNKNIEVLSDNTGGLVGVLRDAAQFLTGPFGTAWRIIEDIFSDAGDAAEDTEKKIKRVIESANRAMGIMGSSGQKQPTGLALLGWGVKPKKAPEEKDTSWMRTGNVVGISERALAESRKGVKKLKNEVEELTIAEGKNIETTYSMEGAILSFSDKMDNLNVKVSEWAENFQDKWGKIVSYMMQSAQQLSSVFNMFHQNRLNDLTAQEQAERAKWEAALEGAANYDEEMERLSQYQEERRKRMQEREARRQKAIATFQAVIGGAMAILSVLADMSLPWWAKITAVGFIGGLAGAQVAAINGAQLPAFAGGGVVPRSGPILVGERGPEIINANAGAVVTPNHRMGGGMSLQTDFDREKFIIWTGQGMRHHSFRRAGG